MKSPIADFPDWFGPMLVKELRQGLKTRGFVLSFIVLQFVLVLVLVYHVLLYSQNVKDFDPSDLGSIFWALIGGLLLVVTPLRAFNELASERKANTLELIFMSGLSASRIVLGKWVSLLFQALLFLLAVLPYAILRYYFGGVDLAADLRVMMLMLLACAVLSAAALALSGMPLWVRALSAVLAVPVTFSLLSGLMVSRVTGRFLPSLGFDSVSWWLLGWDAAVLCLTALQVGAATVAPIAENHAGLQRFLALLLWVPLPVMHTLHVATFPFGLQLALFSAVAGVLIWHHLSTQPAPLSSYARPFAGWRAPFGVPFQPGWPGAVVFLLLALALFAWGNEEIVMDFYERRWYAATAMMCAAGLLCATLYWRVCRRRARFPLAEETLFSLLCGLAVALLLAGKPRTVHLGDFGLFGFLPPTAVWAMQDRAYPAVSSGGLGNTRVDWSAIALAALAGYALILLAISSRYWLQYFRLCRAARRPAPILPAVNRDELTILHARARAVAALMRLPLRRRAWRGAQGDWQGLGTGNSLDFQDHRPYVPGDDLRHLNWQAYARTGHYTMKLFRQEVSPAVDLAVDLSASMFLDAEKSARTAELLYWAVESALEAGASLRLFAVRGAEFEPLALDSVLGHEWARTTASAEPPALAGVPWRHGSLRVVLSDLLWPGGIQPVVQALDERGGSGLLLAPWCAAEAEPDWNGNLQMHDCESQELRLQRLERGALQQYRAAYARHFGLWEEQALRYRVPLARIASAPRLAEALRPHVAATGAVEWSH